MFKEEKLFLIMITNIINTDLFTNIDLDTINLINDYKDKKNTLENKIKNIELKYMTDIEDIKKFCNNNEKSMYNNITSLEILTKEVNLIKIILKYSLSNNQLEINFLKKSLNYLFILSDILKKRLKQKDIELSTNYELSRCSYKFCTFKENCNYFYSKKQNSKCYQDHYVHNMVSHDIKVLLSYINQQYDDNLVIKQNKEILRTLNTLSFVIGHMETELKAKCIYLDKNEWNKFH